ncbi:MAG: GntR family transcriptional regulator [Eubacteriales bacterium]|jgi:GntR family transcriptional regulator
MDILISNASGKPIYEQITSQIKTLILNGQLQEGEMLPSMRQLARDLRVSVITTKRAYEDLERDGFISTVAGKGCFVRARNLELLREEQLRRVQTLLEQAVELARSGGITQQEVMEMLEILYGGE